MTRKEKMKKLVKEIQDRHDKLKKLGYVLSDRASTICVFDTGDESEGPEGKVVDCIILRPL